MATMGRYCKAYPVSRYRRYPGWSEQSENLRKDKKTIDGKEELSARVLGDDDCLYLQENFVVTDGIFLDENVIFDQVTPQWRQFCIEELNFEIPEYLKDDAVGGNGNGQETPSPLLAAAGK